MDWTDARPLAELTLGIDSPDEDRPAVAAFVRETLERCGVKVADDIVGLGCTGLLKNGCSIETADEIRLGLAGSGVGLTCFVGPDRYCLVHKTVGGLQEGQEPLHTEFVEVASRPLTEEERYRVDLVENARRVEARSNLGRMLEARDLLSGRTSIADEDDEDDDETETEDQILAAARQKVRDEAMAAPASWTCPEHGEVFWGCRFCVASLIARGPFDLKFLFDDGSGAEELMAQFVGPKVQDLNASDAESFELFVRAARWSRKLTME